MIARPRGERWLARESRGCIGPPLVRKTKAGQRAAHLRRRAVTSWRPDLAGPPLGDNTSERLTTELDEHGLQPLSEGHRPRDGFCGPARGFRAAPPRAPDDGLELGSLGSNSISPSSRNQYSTMGEPWPASMSAPAQSLDPEQDAGARRAPLGARLVIDGVLAADAAPRGGAGDRRGPRPLLERLIALVLLTQPHQPHPQARARRCRPDLAPHDATPARSSARGMPVSRLGSG